jgi:Cenp-O kinetochore centromere component
MHTGSKAKILVNIIDSQQKKLFDNDNHYNDKNKLVRSKYYPDIEPLASPLLFASMSLNVGREKKNDSNEPRQRSIVTIHEKVLAVLRSKQSSTDTPNHRLKCRLEERQSHRLYLASEIAQVRSQEALTTQALTHRRRLDGDDGQTPPDAHILQQVRQKRKWTAAYRLGGITAATPKMEDELLSFRFDICLEGVYVATYHAFFDVIVVPPDNQLYLRLTQHTIPSAIPIFELSGGSSFWLLGKQPPNEQAENWETEKVQTILQEWSRKCYRACLCWHQRKQAWQSLQKYKRSVAAAAGHRSFRVDSIMTTTSEAYHQISFHLLPSSSGSRCYYEVTLVYGDWVKAVPSSVKVLPRDIPPSSGDNTNDAGNVRNHSAKQIEEAFLHHTVEQAIEDVLR